MPNLTSAGLFATSVGGLVIILTALTSPSQTAYVIGGVVLVVGAVFAVTGAIMGRHQDVDSELHRPVS